MITLYCETQARIDVVGKLRAAAKILAYQATATLLPKKRERAEEEE
jgi:hypothetical protein